MHIKHVVVVYAHLSYRVLHKIHNSKQQRVAFAVIGICFCCSWHELPLGGVVDGLAWVVELLFVPE